MSRKTIKAINLCDYSRIFWHFFLFFYLATQEKNTKGYPELMSQQKTAAAGLQRGEQASSFQLQGKHKILICKHEHKHTLWKAVPEH